MTLLAAVKARKFLHGLLRLGTRRLRLGERKTLTLHKARKLRQRIRMGILSGLRTTQAGLEILEIYRRA